MQGIIDWSYRDTQIFIAFPKIEDLDVLVGPLHARNHCKGSITVDIMNSIVVLTIVIHRKYKTLVT